MAEAGPEESVVSLQDVLEEDQQLEQTANAVLGDSDDSQCTYTKGYVQRQAVYACGTCVGGDMEPAGMCLACSLHCHDGHELYELYTKRYFRCDCGNSKFPNATCILCPDKDPVNGENKYSHNFHGLYCTCKRPYPDPEDEVEDEMIQCSVCEDWFHSRHLGGVVPTSFVEMVCDACMKSCEFLRAYRLHPQPVKVGREEGGSVRCVDVTGEASASKGKSEDGPSGAKTTPVTEDTSSSYGRSVVVEGCELGKQDSGKQVPGAETGKLCELKKRRSAMGALGEGQGSSDGAGFFGENWRVQLCRCVDCKTLYSSTGSLYLLSEDDAVAAYEKRGSSRLSTHDAGMVALSASLDRVQQVEVFHQYNELKSELTDYLKAFARDGKVVSKRNIEEFFEGMETRKRRRLENGDGVPPQNCHF